MEYANDYDGVGFEQFAKSGLQEPSAFHAQPVGAVPQRVLHGRNHDFADNELPQHLADVLPDRRWGGRSRAYLGSTAQEHVQWTFVKRAVKVSASVLTSDPYTESSQVQPDVNTLTRNAAAKAYETAGVGPEDLDLVELHDCFATAELIHYDNLGLCERGGAGDFIDSGAPFRDGTTPVNVSGGLISKGHPIGATGVANVFEVTTHLRGEAGDRQIPDAKVGLAHVIGLGSACGIHVLEKAAV